jgi:DNA polymerase III subunit delta'
MSSQANKNKVKDHEQPTEHTLRLAELPWFESILAKLKQAYNDERLAHGLIICAPKGSGKQAFARSFIKSILCQKSSATFTDFCSQCKSCLLFEAASFPDYHQLERLTDNKGKQKQSIGIEQIRQLTDKLADTAQLSGWRVALITSVSDLTTASFNALLKTLEEPGDKTLLVLLADNLQSVPATIRSRCQLVLPKLNNQSLLNWLEQQTEITDQKQLQLSLQHCYHAPLLAKQYLLNGGFDIRLKLNQLGDALLLNQINPQIFLEQVPAELSIDQIILWMTDYLLEVEKAILSRSGNQHYMQLNPKLPIQLYHKLTDYLRAQSAGSNLQPKLQLQSILIQWYEAGRKIIQLSTR